jgi:hypothetical protein
MCWRRNCVSCSNPTAVHFTSGVICTVLACQSTVRGAICERGPLPPSSGIEKLVVRHFQQTHATMQGSQSPRVIQVGIGASIPHLRRIAVQKRAQIVRRGCGHDGVVIDELVEGHGNRILRVWICAGIRGAVETSTGVVHVRRHPIGAGLRVSFRELLCAERATSSLRQSAMGLNVNRHHLSRHLGAWRCSLCGGHRESSRVFRPSRGRVSLR